MLVDIKNALKKFTLKGENLKMKSMTGYGKAEFRDEKYEIFCDIRSVNHKYFNISINLPENYIALEDMISKLVNEKIKRGKISIRYNILSKKKIDLKLNREYLISYKKLLQETQEILDLEVSLSLDMILENAIIENEIEDPELNEIIFLITQKALDRHQNMAKKEGQAMHDYIKNSYRKMKTAMANIKEKFPLYKSKIRNDMEVKIEELMRSKLQEEDYRRIMLEIAIYIDKADVTEEIVRFLSHLDKFQNALKIPQAGKKLNFILQEMQRESKTISDKFKDETVFNHILMIKEELEKCREIVQNVE